MTAEKKRPRTKAKRGTWESAANSCLKTMLERLEDLSRDCEDIQTLRGSIEVVAHVAGVALSYSGGKNEEADGDGDDDA